MIKLNIKKNNKVQVKSFANKTELDNHVLDFIGAEIEMTSVRTGKAIGNFTDVSNKIWDLNVGTSITINNGWFETTISMSGKSPYHNTEHGKQMYGS